MSLTPGTRLGPYEIVGPLGAGGMGEVYRARDTRLERTVAVKVLPAHAAADPEFKARFEREAKTISQLNHPNICVLHDVGESAGVSFLVMELLEGDTLATRLQKGPLPTGDVLRIASEIAGALDRAHRNGIIHRDLKPANVMLTPTGSKLLDFGLAKSAVVSAAIDTHLAGASQAPLTSRGTILGTFQYMAPEQIEGDASDMRTDIWAFGCVLYEMVTGRRAFDAKSQASLIASILERHPTPIAELQPMTPPALDRTVRTCLAKNPDDRFQSARDLALQLEWIEDGGSTAGVPAPVLASRRRKQYLIVAGIALAAGVAAAAVAWNLKALPTAPVGSVARFLDLLPADQALTRPGRRTLAISPDGTKVAYVANQQIYLRKLSEPQAAPIPGTLTNPAEPVFSPDGQSIAFWSNGLHGIGDQGGKVWRVPVTGGTPTPICDSNNPHGMSWSGPTIYIGLVGTIVSVPDTGGTATQLVKADTAKNERLGHPQLTRDGRDLVFTLNAGGRSWDSSQIVVQDLATSERRVLVSGGTSPRLLASGHLAFFRESTIFVQVFDERAATVRGTAVPMVQQARYASFTGAGDFSVSETGTLAMIEAGDEEHMTPGWVDRSGKATPIAAPKRRYFDPRLSPDGTMVAMATIDESPDIYVWDLRRGVETRVSRDEARDGAPMWLDNRELVFVSEPKTGGAFELVRRRVDLTTARTVIATVRDSVSPRAISPDGKTLVGGTSVGGVPGLARFSLEKPGPSTPLLDTNDPVGNASISPDGRWIAFEAREGEMREVYVRPFPSVTQARYQISQGGGIWPAWSRDGKELFYVQSNTGHADSQLVAVPVKPAGGQAFDWGKEVRLFNAQPYLRGPNRGYDVGIDGTKFLMIVDDPAQLSTRRTTIRYVTNWFEELRARVK